MKLSAYLSNYDLDYLQKAYKMGYKEIFVSLHIEEELKNKQKLTKFINELNEIGFDLIADISTKTIEIFSFEELRSMKIKKLRIDYGFTNNDIVKISNNFDIVLNASTLTDNQLEELKELGLNLSKVEALHNFYPKEETGLDFEEFKKQNKRLKKYELKIDTFIPGDKELRGPIYKGLPTIEEHREQTPYINYLSIKDFSDNVYIGDPKISLEQLELISKADKGLITIYIEKSEELKHLIDKELTIRIDSNQNLFRIEESRTIYKIDSEINPQNSLKREIGDITIDNKLALRYQGEVMIARQKLKANPKLNKISEIQKEHIPLLKLDLRGKKIILIPK